MSQENRKPRTKKRRRMNPFLYLGLVVATSAILASVAWNWAEDVLALNKAPASAVITIAEGDSVGSVASQLKKSGLIEHKFLFKLFCSITGVEKKDKLTAGTYELNTDMDYNALVNSMSAKSSSRMTASVTIPEGYTIDQIFDLLVEKGVATRSTLEKVAAEYDFKFSFLKDVVPLGDYHRLEGYLFPDTYEFYMGGGESAAVQVLNKMILRFDSQFTDEFREQAAKKGYSVRDILTIASLIEKETDGEDQKKIASVIYNRLNNPSYETVGLLQIDAALVYALGRSITQEDYTAGTPYNTYTNKGLPPSPIASPGMVSLNAALNPDSTNYYYYVLGKDNKHHFFRTHKEQLNYIASMGS